MNIEISHCYYRYSYFISGREYALKDINLSISSGQIIGLVGSNGAGKSTLISLLAGLLKPMKGMVKVNGADIYHNREKLTAFHRSLALVTQNPEDQFFCDSVYQELSYDLRQQGLTEQQIQSKITDCLKDLALDKEGILSMSPFSLTGSDKRLMAIALSLLKCPQVLILDEPTARLDDQAKARLWTFLSNWGRNHSATVIIVSHEIEKIASLAETLVLLHEGKIIAQGDPAEILLQNQRILETGFYAPLFTLCLDLIREGVVFEKWPVFELMEVQKAINKWLEE